MDGFGCVVLSVVRRTHIWLKGVSGGDVFRFTLVKQAHASARKRTQAHASANARMFTLKLL